MMAGMFWYFGDTENKTTYGLETFPDNLIHMMQHVISKAPIPYIPGAPFLWAGFLAFLAIITFVLVTTKADRQARYEVNNESASSDETIKPSPAP